jgi:DNA-binding response OmpR family regulator
MSNKRLLIVDDEAAFGAFVRRIAEKLDFEVKVTTNPRAFKEIFHRFNPTVLVLDIIMPDVDGIELVRWLATIQCTARIIIISGFDPKYTKIADVLGSVAGLTSIIRLAKPVSVDELRNALS